MTVTVTLILKENIFMAQHQRVYWFKGEVL